MKFNQFTEDELLELEQLTILGGSTDPMVTNTCTQTCDTNECPSPNPNNPCLQPIVNLQCLTSCNLVNYTCGV